MLARELTPEDIGCHFWVETAAPAVHKWARICFEGFTENSARVAALDEDTEQPYWLIVKCSPGSGNACQFRNGDGSIFTGVLVRARSDVWPVQVDWAVTREGAIVEVAERTA